MKIKLRRINSSDFEDIISINKNSIPEVSEIDKDYFDHMLNESSYFFAAELQGSLVGYICAFSSDDHYDASEFKWFQELHKSNFLYIDQVGISPQYRRAGVGKFMYQNLEELALRGRYKNLSCEVNIEPLNIVSKAFHEKLGFVEVGTMNTRAVVLSLLNKPIGKKPNKV